MLPLHRSPRLCSGWRAPHPSGGESCKVILPPQRATSSSRVATPAASTPWSGAWSSSLLVVGGLWKLEKFVPASAGRQRLPHRWRCPTLLVGSMDGGCYVSCRGLLCSGPRRNPFASSTLAAATTTPSRCRSPSGRRCCEVSVHPTPCRRDGPMVASLPANPLQLL